ncbi:MAG: hypothetical protein JXB14_07240 [Candidatus Altiarchaeota archaeon]|nr:hypothetical protein [Candidatus Altiarchaeota archaeon]
MQTYESRLRKEAFLQRISGMETEGVVSVDETGSGNGKPTGFIIGGVWVSIFVGPKDSVWVGLMNSKRNPKTTEVLLRELQLTYVETYPYVLESPSEEVMEIWQRKKRS